MKFLLILSLFMSFSAFGMDWQAIVEGEDRTGKMLDEVVQIRKESEEGLVQAQFEVQELKKQTPQEKSDKLKKMSALGEIKHGEAALELQGITAECAGWKELAIEWQKQAKQLQGQVESLQAALKETNQSQRQVGTLLAATNRQGFYTQAQQVSIIAVPLLLYFSMIWCFTKGASW